MTRKHFRAIAEVIKSMKEEKEKQGDLWNDTDELFYLTLELAKTFKELNANFDLEIFMDACGFEKNKEVVNI
jgi:hypothetical protein